MRRKYRSWVFWDLTESRLQSEGPNRLREATAKSLALSAALLSSTSKKQSREIYLPVFACLGQALCEHYKNMVILG